jgi:transposase-like protein
MNWDGFAYVLVIVILFVVSSVSISVVELSFALRKEVEVRKIEPITNIQNCIYCKSFRIVKDGLRHNKHDDIQKFNCKECSKYFTIINWL